MARTVPPTKALNFQDRDLLRAIYYRQQLPFTVLALGTSHLSNRLQVLEMGGYLRKELGQLNLTDAGKSALRIMFEGRKPPMIDTLRQAKLDPKAKKSQFVVGSSLARKIAREVSGGA